MEISTTVESTHINSKCNTVWTGIEWLGGNSFYLVNLVHYTMTGATARRLLFYSRSEQLYDVGFTRNWRSRFLVQASLRIGVFLIFAINICHQLPSFPTTVRCIFFNYIWAHTFSVVRGVAKRSNAKKRRLRGDHRGSKQLMNQKNIEINILQKTCLALAKWT